jgi:hypothetical protein
MNKIMMFLLAVGTFSKSINSFDTTNYRLIVNGVGYHNEYIVPVVKLENILNKITQLKQVRNNFMNDIEVSLINIFEGRIMSARLSSQFINEIVQGLNKISLPQNH